MSDGPPSSIRIFEGAQHLNFNNPTFIGCVNQISAKLGLDKLLAHSMRDAFHDSSDRWPPPRCHYDSRQELRTIITDWGTGRSKTLQEFLLWMHGPFGVGKSAIAQSSAEALAAAGVLGASLFFSRPHQRNNPNHVFTSIAYQLGLKNPLLADILDHKILSNPTILTAARSHQFLELLVKPLHEIRVRAPDISGWVIILDGLDEVDGIDAQCDIINTVATSIRDCTTPFRWFILSRPESHIQRAMRASNVIPLLCTLDLPLSSLIDHEILTFFVKELQKIGEQHALPPSWCSDADFATLVELAGGLWIYVSTVTRFIGDPNSLGPHTQLRFALSLAQRNKNLSPVTNPLAAMDQFYNLIVRQIPPRVISTVRAILLLRQTLPFLGELLPHYEIYIIANLLQLSLTELCNACSFLQSVLFIVMAGDRPAQIRFYHASFMEYMLTPERSGELCVFGDSLENLQREMILQVNSVHSRSMNGRLKLDLTWETNIRWGGTHIGMGLIYYSMIYSMFSLCANQARPISPSTAEALQNTDFSVIPYLAKSLTVNVNVLDLAVDYHSLRDNLPPEYRDKIIRKSTDPLHLNKSFGECGSEHAFILGVGSRQLICWPEASHKDRAELNLAYAEYKLAQETQTAVGSRTLETQASLVKSTGKVENQEDKITGTRGEWIPRWLRVLLSQKPHQRN